MRYRVPIYTIYATGCLYILQGTSTLYTLQGAYIHYIHYRVPIYTTGYIHSICATECLYTLYTLQGAYKLYIHYRVPTPYTPPTDIYHDICQRGHTTPNSTRQQPSSSAVAPHAQPRPWACGARQPCLSVVAFSSRPWCVCVCVCVCVWMIYVCRECGAWQ